MITVIWDDADPRLLRTTFQKPWSWAEWDEAAKTITEKLAASKPPVYMLQDIRNAGFPPNGGVWRFRQITNNTDDKVEMVIFIGMSGFIRSLVETIQRLSLGNIQKDQFVFVGTIEEARALLPKAMASLAPETPADLFDQPPAATGV